MLQAPTNAGSIFGLAAWWRVAVAGSDCYRDRRGCDAGIAIEIVWCGLAAWLVCARGGMSQRPCRWFCGHDASGVSVCRCCRCKGIRNCLLRPRQCFDRPFIARRPAVLSRYDRLVRDNGKQQRFTSTSPRYALATSSISRRTCRPTIRGEVTSPAVARLSIASRWRCGKTRFL